ncbi:MAG: hypothetical protein ACE5PV_01970, partial [Candidatus Poribacteria bacterium]
KSSAREIQSLLTYARDVAMTENVAYLVVFDLDEQRYWLTSSENFDAENTTSSLVTSSLTTMLNFQQSTSVSEEESSDQEFSSSRTAMIAGIPRKPATGVEIAAINITAVHEVTAERSEHDYSSSTYSYSNPELSSAKSNARLRLSEGINSGAEVTTGAEYIYFTPKGTSEDMVLYLQDKTGKMMSVSVERETGQVSIRKESQNAMGQKVMSEK